MKESVITSLDVGNEPTKAKRARRNKESRIKSIRDQFVAGQRNFILYMDAMSINVKIG
jgi:hypothetical protein